MLYHTEKFYHGCLCATAFLAFLYAMPHVLTILIFYFLTFLCDLAIVHKAADDLLGAILIVQHFCIARK